ncbi:carbohydrate ABC transporter substrate-binding protein (CUT1 family) [Aliiruegeria haliotis]|uniref:Carbohydrate ABC transporter substrate-binding protein (CUT1 family) n=1 Tax=Aliiruegeria haliotis TaxID=1280846 RepID=A0A2T0RM54_9RHOB|nr:extracellular solute-binding protein [Aliiruegeria haliotis]PRY22265.1 carbohydrate ABC transporter substrate-binding protein (CUT1 family) [Aliiruegeria haliotis]
MKHLKTGLVSAIAALAVTAGAVQAETVEFMNWVSAEETGKEKMTAMADSFKEATGNEVDLQGYAWGDMNKNYVLRARSKTLPNVGQSQGRLLPIIAGIPEMQDFNEIFGKDKLAEMFPASFLAAGEIDGKQLGLPWIGGTIGWVANQEVLDAAGITEMPETVEEFKAALIQVRDNVPNSVPLGLATKNHNSIVLDYITWLWTFGGDVMVDGKPAVNSPEAVAALSFLTDAVSERLAAPEIDRPDARRLFAQGATAFYLDAPLARTFARKFSGRDMEIDPAVKPIKAPVLNAGDDPVSVSWGHLIVAFGDEAPAADSPAMQWVMHLLSNEQLVGYAVNQSVLPTTNAALESEEVKADTYLTEWAAATVAPRRNTIASMEKGAEVSAVIGEEFQAAILGQKTAEEAANDMQSRLEGVLAE